MTSANDPRDLSSYDRDLLVGLGLVTTEFSRLEGTVKDVLAMFVSPHQMVGRAIVAKMNFATAVEDLRAILEERLADGELKKAVRSFVREADSLATQRNELVHSRWAQRAVTFKDVIKRGKFDTVFREPAVTVPYELARAMWRTHEEGHHLIFDLASAGFSDLTTIDGSGTSRRLSHRDYQLPDSPLLGRPEVAEWPGQKHWPTERA